MGQYQAICPAGAAFEWQTGDCVLMVEPACFGFNPETATSNRFAAPPATEVAGAARREFEALSERLEAAGVVVHRLPDTHMPPKPDALFPNNWVSFHADGTLVTYPLEATSRRAERRVEPLTALLAAARFEVRNHIDLSHHEQAGRYLEGTGSLILDRPRRRAYACLSSRTHAEAVADFDLRLGYATLTFGAHDPAGRPIYHSNVAMSLGSRFALLCLGCVDPADRRRLVEDIEVGGRVLIEVDYSQLLDFACNIIELRNARGDALVAMSSGAWRSFRPDQRRVLEQLAGELIHVPVPTIERVAGGGVRCMIADVHLPRAA